MSELQTFAAVAGSVVWWASTLCCWLAAAWLQRSRRKPGAARFNLAAALALTGLWSASSGWFGAASTPTALAEALRNLGWIFALYRLFEIDGRHASVRPVRPLLAALAFVELLQVAIALVLTRNPVSSVMLEHGLPTTSMLHLLVVIGGLVLLHNLYGGASIQARRVLRWPAIAMVLIWTVDLNLYAIAYLAGATPLMLAMLRSLLGIPVAALVAAGAANESEDQRFKPSRAVAFQSLSLLLIGGYLMAMVVAAQWLAFAGRDFAVQLQLIFVAAAVLIALAVLPSRRLRGWLRVTLAKHLFQLRYDYRAEWLRFTRTIGAGGANQTSLEERVIRAIADITDSPGGLLLSPVEGGRFELASRWQWPTAQVPPAALDAAEIREIELHAYVADLDELRAGRTHPRIAPPLPEWLMAEPRAWALVPLLHFEKLVGAVVLARPPHTRALDWEDFDLLRVAGQQLASYLAEHAGQEALAEAARFDDFHRRIAFVMHDIKNLASQMGLLARNAESHADNPEFRADMLVTLRNSADKLNALLARLSRYGAAAVGPLVPVRADEVAQAIVKQTSARHAVVLVEREPVEVAAERGSLEQVLLHLVQNAIDASAADAPVFVRVASEGLNGVIEVVDTGCGMSPEFVRNRLFKPFDSTKQGGFGIGAYEARELVRAMSGRLEVDSHEQLGTRFTILLPRADTAHLIKSLAAAGNAQQKVA